MKGISKEIPDYPSLQGAPELIWRLTFIILNQQPHFPHKTTRLFPSRLQPNCTPLSSVTIMNVTYCAFQKHANSEVQKPPSQLRFSLPSIIITITRNGPWKTENHSKSNNHELLPFEHVKVNFCFPRGPPRWLTVAKNANVNWLWNFIIRVFLKGAVK